MFRCTDCNTEYEIKPDYCDCGNDTFVEIEQNNQQASNEPKNNQDYSIREECTINPPEDKEISEQKKGYDYKKDLPSIIFFVICIILSVLSLIFIGNGTDKKEETAENSPKVEIKNVKSIDEIWKTRKREETLAVLEKSNIKEPEVKKEIKQAVLPIKKEENKQIKTQPKTAPQTKKTTVANTNTTKTTAPLNKNTTNTKTSSNNNTTNKNVSKNTASNTVKQNNTNNTAAPVFNNKENNTNTKTTAPIRTASPIGANTNNANNTTSAQKTAVNTQSLSSYKIELRNKIVSNINFKLVIGDGSCAIKFKIDNNGKLTNRSFSSQSDNSSLNDAVYNAIMQTPYFNPPPASYTGEFLTLYIKIYGGSFEISLK